MAHWTLRKTKKFEMDAGHGVFTHFPTEKRYGSTVWSSHTYCHSMLNWPLRWASSAKSVHGSSWMNTGWTLQSLVQMAAKCYWRYGLPKCSCAWKVIISAGKMDDFMKAFCTLANVNKRTDQLHIWSWYWDCLQIYIIRFTRHTKFMNQIPLACHVYF